MTKIPDYASGEKWLSAPDANLERCRCLLVRLAHQKYVYCTPK